MQSLSRITALWLGRAGVNSTRVARFPDTVRGGYFFGFGPIGKAVHLNDAGTSHARPTRSAPLIRPSAHNF